MNENTNESDSEETREERPMGRDQVKKKSSASDQSKASFSDEVADKWFSIKSLKWGKKNSTTDEYFRLKKQELENQKQEAELRKRELEIQEIARREAEELKREKMELECQKIEFSQT